MTNLSKILIIAGSILILAGLVLWLFKGKLSWVGNLPGDIRISRPGFMFYFPFTTMVLVSLVLSVIIYFTRKMH